MTTPPARSAARRSALRRALSRARAPYGDTQWMRVVMNRAIDSFFATMDVGALDAIEISGDGHGRRLWRSYQVLRYPTFDVCASPSDDEPRADVVILEQVLEHVTDPTAALAHLWALVRPGGHVLVSTPFLVRIHEEPGDYWRFTKVGLEILLERQGFEVVTSGQWGNAAALRGNLGRWRAYRSWHSLRNDPRLPLVVWVAARRPEESPAIATYEAP